MFDKRRIRKNGVLAQAEVISVEDRSRFATSDGYHTFEHTIHVGATEREPFTTVVRQQFNIVDLRPKTGQILQVRYDPGSLECVFVLEGDPRYDVDAMNVRSAAIRAGLPEAMRDGTYERATVVPVASSPAAPPAAGFDPVARLEGLARLHAAGVLTDAEFAEQKAKALADT